ncbi:XrtA system polysaccharide chain length determinant [Cellvibrio sp.]|uniref:XrtA system polysaccharide chain length determinant n=1 Tax=Cellvibrio sp. TaxID=1965322 RepID=UPI00396475DE
MDKVYLRDLLWAIKAELIKFRFWVVTLFVVVSFLVLAIGAFKPKTYATSAMLVVDVTNIIEPLMKGQAEVTKVDRSEQAREVIYTRGIMEAVGKELKLITKDTSPEDQDRIIKTIRSGLEVKPEKSNYFRIAYNANDPDVSFETLNAFVNVFIRDTQRRKNEESQGAYKFIDAQVQTYKHQLETAEEKLKEFNSKNVDGNSDSVNARINQLRSDIESLKITIEESQARVNTLQQQLGSEGQYQQAKGQVDEIKLRRQSLTEQLERLLSTYQEGYPDIVNIRAQIAELDAIIEKRKSSGEVYGGSEKSLNPLYEELRKQLSVADVDLKAQRRRMESLLGLQALERSRAERVAANQAEYSELTRDYQVTQKVYNDLVARKENARISMTLDQEGQGISYRIQEPAVFPLKPVGIGFIIFAILGPILGVLVPVLLVIAYVILDPHLRSARALQKQLPPEIEMLGVIPHYNSPIGERLLKRDMISIFAIAGVGMILYVTLAVYWQVLHG